MPRTRSLRSVGSTFAAVAVAVLGLSGCGSAAPGTDAADPDSIAQRVSAVGIAPELVYTTAVDGYDLAPQSVGPSDSDGMSATWFNETTGAMLTIRTARGELTAETCAETPLWDAPAETVTCSEEDGMWHRSGSGVHEYVAIREGTLISVTGRSSASPEDLRAAAQAVHVPSDAELELLFFDTPEVPATPVERGDLPENGDGAPIDPVGPGG